LPRRIDQPGLSEHMLTAADEGRMKELPAVAAAVPL